MSRDVVNDVMMPIRLPSDLKGAFDGLCKARGVSVASEVRRLMAQEVLNTTLEQIAPEYSAPKSKPTRTARKVKTAETSETSVTARCDKTPDFFGTAETSQNASREGVSKDRLPTPTGTLKNAKNGNEGLPDLAISAMNARKNRKKAKKRKR